MFHDAVPVDRIHPGETMIVDVDGFPVAIANLDGAFYAFQSLCPHRGASFAGRPVVDCVIECSQHSSRYDVTTGACVQPSVPAGFSQDLMTFPTRVIDHVVQVDV
jgi:3-phenylpropionate/trans-cinnamate dioxygenase ferredoxin subunit